MTKEIPTRTNTVSHFYFYFYFYQLLYLFSSEYNNNTGSFVPERVHIFHSGKRMPSCAIIMEIEKIYYIELLIREKNIISAKEKSLK